MIIQRLEELYSLNGEKRVSLVGTKNAFRDGRIDLETVKCAYEEWVSQDLGLVLQWQGGVKNDFRKETITRLASKRGNRLYRFQMASKVEKLKRLVDNFEIRITEETTNALFVTLTDDPKKRDLFEAWEREKREKGSTNHRKRREDIGSRFNRFITSVRREFGHVEVICRSFEATQKGRPHVHALLVFETARFDTFLDESKTVRIDRKKEFEKWWDAWIDIEGARDAASAVYYITKEVLKDTLDVQLGSTTLALMWVFRKRAFSISKRLEEMMGRLDEGDCLTQIGKRRGLDLFGLPLSLPEGGRWVFVGIASWSACLKEQKRGQKEGLWSYELKQAPAAAVEWWEAHAKWKAKAEADRDRAWREGRGIAYAG